jgi:hypothetical protein
MLTTAVKLQSTLKLNLLLCFSDACPAKLGIALFRRVESIDISLMMLGMMESHDFLRNVRFKSLEGVPQSATDPFPSSRKNAYIICIGELGERMFASNRGTCECPENRWAQCGFDSREHGRKCC